MVFADPIRSGTSQLEEFAALNDELAGLARAGLPLELGLGTGRGQRLAERITDRLRQGRTLGEAVREEGNGVPPAYRAVVEAGLKSGRLAEAVETVARATRAMVSLRRRLALATIYPAVLVVTAFALAVLILPRLLETIVETGQEPGEAPSRLGQTGLWLLRDNPTYWQLWLPVLVLTSLWVTGGLASASMRLPGLGPAMRAYRVAAFADLAAGLLDQGTPFDEALTLAATASGDRALAQDAATVSERIRSGQPAREALAGFESLPSFARWMIGAGASAGTLPATLRQVADWSNRRAAARADWFAILAPLVVTLVVGGAVVAGFAVVSLGPVIDLLYRLSREISM